MVAHQEGASGPKTPAASRVEMTQLILPTHTNAMGTVFGGQITAWVDIAAAVAAMRHSGGLAVTASMDEVHFLHGARKGDVAVIRAQVNFTGRTSMEVGVRVECQNPVTGERHHTLSAYLTFVAVDAEGRPRPVPAIEPVTEDDQRRFAKARARREERLKKRQAALERARRKGEL